jgi:hypothetical protein
MKFEECGDGPLRVASPAGKLAGISGGETTEHNPCWKLGSFVFLESAKNH